MTITPSAALKALRNLFYAGTGAASALLLMVLLIVAGRVLGDEAYGRFSFALALAMVLEVLMDFGLKEVVTRSVARDHAVAPTLVAQTYGVKALLSLIGLALVTLAAFVLRPEPEVRAACVLLGLSAVLRSYLLTVRHLLNGLERFGLDSIVLISDRVLLLTIGTWALWAGHGLLGLCTAFVLARLVAFAFAHLLARAQVGPIGVRVDSEYWWKLVRVAAPFGVFTAVLNLYSYVDTLMLGELRTDQETGLYSAAHRIYEGVVNLASITATVAGPQLARDFVHNRTRHSHLARLVVVASLAAAIPIAIVVALVASRAMTTLFGAEYASAAGVLQILVAGLVFVFPLQIMQAVAVSVNEERRLVRAAIIGCVANVAFNAALIPAFGMFGSATATVISEGISLTVIVIGVRHIVWSSSSHPIEVPAERGP